jgi:hypothetical protein
MGSDIVKHTSKPLPHPKFAASWVCIRLEGALLLGWLEGNNVTLLSFQMKYWINTVSTNAFINHTQSKVLHDKGRSIWDEVGDKDRSHTLFSLGGSKLFGNGWKCCT